MIVRESLSTSPAGARQTGLAFERFANPAIPHRTDTGAGTLRLVSSWPTGDATERSYGDLAIAIQLALDLAGSAAGGFALEYEALDNSTEAYANVWDATTEIANANQALEDPETVAFIGGIHAGALQQSIPILSQAVPPLLVVSPAATWPGLTREVEGITDGYEPSRYYRTGMRNFVRFGPTDDRQGAVAARWAFQTAGRGTAAVFHDNGRYGRCVALAFAAAFTDQGGVVTETTALPADPVNFDRSVASVIEADADCVFIGGVASPQLGQLIGELRGQRSPEALTILGGDGLLSDVMTGEPPSGPSEGLIGVGPPFASELSGDGEVWFETMRDRIGQSRNPHPFAVHAFEATIAIVQAIDRAGSGDRAAILAAVQETRFPGPSGPVSLDADGDRESVQFQFTQIRDGLFQVIGTEAG